VPFTVALRGWRVSALIAAVSIAGAAAAIFYFPRNLPEDGRRAEAARLMNDLMSGKVRVGGPFTLTDPFGKRKSLSDFRGKLVLLYFGFTYCPDVCPTDLLAIGQAIKSLATDGDELQPVFITLDPERDTPETLRSYVASFHPRFVALSGTVAEVRQVATAYKVFFEKVRPPGASTYLIDHMAFTFLLDREGRYVGLFPPGTPAERMAAIVGEHVKSP
jgi:cytochrome oxidase Cu insertion factor (SCO1/SenC/PrrC family)